jgi:hypothetical protein
MRKKLGELLVESGAVAAAAVQRALQQQGGGDSRRLGELLVEAGACGARQVARALGTQHDLPFSPLGELSPKAAALVPLQFQQDHRLVIFGLEPDGRGERLLVALEDPQQLEVVDELRFQLQRSLRAFITSRADLESAFARLRGEAPARAPEPEDDDGLPVVGGEVVMEGTPVDEPPTLELPSEWADAEPPPAAGPPAAPPPAAPPAVAAAPAAAPQAASAPAPASRPVPGPPPVLAAAPGAPPAAPPPAPPAPAAAPVASALAAPAPAAPAAPLGAASAEAAPTSGAAGPVPSRPEAAAGGDASDRLDFSDADLQVLEAIDRLAAGAPEEGEAEKVRPARMVASLVRLLMRKGVIHELEFLEELSRK